MQRYHLPVSEAGTYQLPVLTLAYPHETADVHGENDEGHDANAVVASAAIRKSDKHDKVT